MPNNPVDVTLAEFTALRAEILQCQQMQTFTFTAALTADAAVAAVAFAQGAGTRVILVLPLVLGGLALLHLDYVRRPLIIGGYIRDHLWPVLRKTNGDNLPCWEEGLAGRAKLVPFRDLDAPWYSQERLLSAAPGFCVFIAPSVAVLFLGFWRVLIQKQWSFWSVAPWWFLGLGIMLVCLVIYRRGPSSWRPQLL